MRGGAEYLTCEYTGGLSSVLTSGACMAFEKRLACFVISSCSSRGRAAKASYLVPIRTGIAVCDEPRISPDAIHSHLVEASGLAIPFFDAVECCFPCKVEHEQYGNGVVGHERQHGYKLSLSTQIPDLSCQRGVDSSAKRRTEKVISVFLMLIAFSIKLTPSVWI